MAQIKIQNQYQYQYQYENDYTYYNKTPTIYRKERHVQPVKSLTVIKEECIATQSQSQYSINKNASAPIKPWYYESICNYSYEVIIKVHELHKYHWHLLSYEWQKYYLDYYTYKLHQNELY